MIKKKEISIAEHCRKIGAKGGKATFKKYGKKHMSMLAFKSSAVRHKLR